MIAGPYPGLVPAPPRQGQIWWSSAPPAEIPIPEQSNAVAEGFSEEQLQDWFSCTTGWKALELTWGAVQSCGVIRARQLKPLLQAALAEAARLGADRLVVRQLDMDELLGRCTALALSAFPNFMVLKLRELNLYDEAMCHLCGAFHGCEALQRLVLDSVWASEGGWSALGAALRVNTSLTALRMRRCLSGPALPALCSALADQRGVLQELRLSHNDLGETGVAEVCKALTRSCSSQAGATCRPSRVATLDLSYNAVVGAACVPAVAASLRAVKSLRSLDLSYNDLGPEGARELCRAVSSAPHLTALRLAATGADDSAAEALARVLQSTAASMPGRGLAAVSLAHNRLGPRGATLLAAAARRPGCGLTDVDLGGNGQVGEAGARAWAAVLSAPGPSCRLTRLVLSGCEVPDSGAYLLGAALKGNSSLRELGLADNHITTSGLALLAEVLKANSTLRLLDVSHNMVGPQGLTPLSLLNSHPHQQTRGGRHGETSQKARDPQLVSSCLVKAELLPEYRNVEAVKRITTQGGAEPLSSRNPSREGVAAMGPSLGGSPHHGGGRNPFRSTDGGDGNPFLSPASSYVNPFLVSPRAMTNGTTPVATPKRRGWSYAGNEKGAKNPFLDDSIVDYSPPDGYDAGYVNPFYGMTDVMTEITAASLPSPLMAATPPPARSARCTREDNPFLSPPDAASEAGSTGGGGDGGGGDKRGDPHEGRQLATRVLTKLGGGGPRSGVDANDDTGSVTGAGGGSSLSGTCLYVSSRASTADEGDLVTDMDVLMVDYLLESLGVASAPSFQTASPHYVDQGWSRRNISRGSGAGGSEGDLGPGGERQPLSAALLEAVAAAAEAAAAGFGFGLGSGLEKDDPADGPAAAAHRLSPGGGVSTTLAAETAGGDGGAAADPAFAVDNPFMTSGPLAAAFVESGDNEVCGLECESAASVGLAWVEGSGVTALEPSYTTDMSFPTLAPASLTLQSVWGGEGGGLSASLPHAASEGRDDTGAHQNPFLL